MSTLLRGLVVQAEVVHAVMMRETRTRFGDSSLGYVWALLDSVLIILTFWALFQLAHRGVPAGMDVFSFICTGLLPYRLFAGAAARVAESIKGNKALLYFPQVFPLDLAIARGLLEAATYSAAFVLLMGAHALYLGDLRLDSALLVVFGFTLAGLLGTVVGLVFCGLEQISNLAERVRAPLLRPLFWISGIFFTAESLPVHFRRIALWNPVFHVVELVRAGWFETYGVDHASPAYVLAWILGLGVVGLGLERAVRRRIDLS